MAPPISRATGQLVQRDRPVAMTTSSPRSIQARTADVSRASMRLSGPNSVSSKSSAISLNSTVPEGEPAEQTVSVNDEASLLPPAGPTDFPANLDDMVNIEGAGWRLLC